jgi:hypothetical protein
VGILKITKFSILTQKNTTKFLKLQNPAKFQPLKNPNPKRIQSNLSRTLLDQPPNIRLKHFCIIECECNKIAEASEENRAKVRFCPSTQNA